MFWALDLPHSELGTLPQSNVYHIFVLLPSYNHCKGQWRQLLPLCYLLFSCCQTFLLCSLSLKKTIDIGFRTVSFMLTLLSYWNTQGVASFHGFHFKHNEPTTFLRKQSTYINLWQCMFFWTKQQCFAIFIGLPRISNTCRAPFRITF